MVDSSDDKGIQKAIEKQVGGSGGGPSKWPWLLAFAAVAIALVLVIVYWGGEDKPLMQTADKPQAQSQAQPKKPVKAPARAPASQGAPSSSTTSTDTGQPASPDAAKPMIAEKAPSPPAPSKHGKVVEVTQPGSSQSASGKTESTGTAAPPSPGAKALSQTSIPGGAKIVNQGAAQEQAKRKAPYGLKKSLDVVLRSDESLKVGKRVIPISELERKMVVGQRGEVLEKPLHKTPKVSAWGLYLVRPGDNLWGIHFRLLAEYMASRGVNLPPNADMPTPQGYSTGVGKILKFAEHMVGVYNIHTGLMTSDLNHLEPGNKLVVYNLTEIFTQLAQMDPKDLSGVSYDGRVLIFPQKDGAKN